MVRTLAELARDQAVLSERMASYIAAQDKLNSSIRRTMFGDDGLGGMAQELQLLKARIHLAESQIISHAEESEKKVEQTFDMKLAILTAGLSIVVGIIIHLIAAAIG